MRSKNIELYSNVISEIKNNSFITERELADKYLVTERTIRRYIKELKDSKKITLVKIGKIRMWKIL